MTGPAASFDPSTGELSWRGFWKSRDDMERLEEAFAHGPYADMAFADQISAAIAAYDAFHGEEDAA